MRLLRKLVIKLVTMVIMVVLMGALLRFAKPYIMKSAGMTEGMPAVEGEREDADQRSADR